MKSKRYGFQFKFILLAVAILLVLSACGKDGKSAGEEGYPNANLLAEVSWIANNLNNDKVVIIDARSKGYGEGHITGAVNLPSGAINDPNNPVDGFLLGADDFTKVVSEIGVNQDSTIVVYDGGNSLSAARIFYALELYGLKDQVKLLDGGYAAWLTAGQETSVDAVAASAGNFKAKENPQLVSTLSEVDSELGNQDIVFLDTRSDDEFNGKDLRGNKNGGHIPGAVHREWSESLVKGDDGVERFKSADELKAEFAELGAVKDKTIVPYCQTNVRGAHTYFTLRLLGYTDVRPYEGSWSEYGNADNTKIEHNT